MIRDVLRLAILLLGCCGVPAAASSSWTELSQACLDRLIDSDGETGSLASECPEVREALRSDPWGELLADAPETLSPWSLIELSAMAEYYRDPVEGATVNPAELDAALQTLPEADAREPLSLWERVLEWLRNLLGADDGDPAWFGIPDLSPTTLVWLWYTVVVAIVLLALAVVVNEIRQQTRRRAGGEGAGSARHSDGAPVSTRGLRAGGPREQLAELFRTIVERLQSLGAVPVRPSLTHREVAAARLPPNQRSAVRELSGAAERAVYGGWSPRGEDVEPYLDAGRRLLDELTGKASSREDVNP